MLNVYKIFKMNMAFRTGVLLSFLSFILMSNTIEAAETTKKMNIHIQKIQYAFKRNFGDVKIEKIIQVGSNSFSSSILYKVYTKNKPYIVRFINKELDDGHREVKSMMIASNRALTPKIYDVDVNEGIIIMDFVSDRSFTEKEQSNPETYIKLAKLIKKLHQSPPFPKFLSIFDAMRLNHKNRGRYLSTLSKEGTKKLVLIENATKNLEVLSSTHNDLNPNNILFDGKDFLIIDWEFAGFGDPFYDLATVSNFYIFDKQLEKIYLKTYFDREPTSTELAHYYLMKQVSLYYYGNELVHLARKMGLKTLTKKQIVELPSLREYNDKLESEKGSLQDPQYLEKFGNVLLKEAITNMNSNKFAKSISLLEHSK